MLRKIIDSPWLYFTLAALLIAVAVYSQLRFEPPGRPEGGADEIRALPERERLNVIFIVIDMLRADRLSAYDYERRTSPILKAMASEGVQFMNVEAQSSWTKASMASMWTGMYPERTGIQRFFHAMPEEAVLPAEIFRDAGYRTAGIWRNGWVANNFGFGQGFDLYIRPRQVRPERKITRPSPGTRNLPGTDMDATLSAMEFMMGAQHDPFFLYVHYMDVHQYLYTDISPDFGTGFSDFYDSSIYWTDFNIGRIQQTLHDLDLADKTMVVIVSDHGEAFFEHGIEGHARNLYREVLDTPWIISLPFRLPAGARIHQRVANVDVWPTLLDMVGLPPLSGAEGSSMLPAILDAVEGRDDGVAESERPVFSQLDRSWGRTSDESNPSLSMVKGAHRINYLKNKPDNVEVFDRVADPKEKRNIAQKDPELVATLKSDIEDFYARPKSEWATAPEIELDAMHLNQLRALGYVIETAAQRPEEGEHPRQKAAARRKKNEAAAGEGQQAPAP